MNFLELLVLALAAHYVTYVLVDSKLLDGVRWRVAQRSRWVGKILTCHHCAAFWSALFVTTLWLVGSVAWWFACACALSSCVQFLYPLRERAEQIWQPPS